MIINPADLVSPPSPVVAANRQRYESDPELRKVADDMHHAGMMSGPACDLCIELAIKGLELMRERDKKHS